LNSAAHLEPTIRINVDVTNPGQFFACCGLLELADRLWPGAEGWFENQAFHVAGKASLHDLLAMLVKESPQELTVLANGVPVKPLIAPLLFSFDGRAARGLTLDAWMTIRREKGRVVAVGNPPWNMWSGQQTSMGIWLALRTALAERLAATTYTDQLKNLFSDRTLLSGRFGLDPGAAWNALDVGFSPNEQGMKVASSAAVEMLAAVGIQRFRPMMADDRQSFDYFTWGSPSTPSVAAPASAGAVQIAPFIRLRCRVVSRGSYAALERSRVLREGAERD
jgi:CRISPR-associated protein Csx14